MADPLTYTCPMHPEVKQPNPGKCPECGMDLKPAEGSGPADVQREAPYTRSGEMVAPKFGSSGSGGAEHEPGPKR